MLMPVRLAAQQTLAYTEVGQCILRADIFPDQVHDGGTKRYSGSFVDTIRAVDMHQCATQTMLRRQQCSSSYPSNITAPSVIRSLDVTLTNDAFPAARFADPTGLVA
jgi:hypothetical protein